MEVEERSAGRRPVWRYIISSYSSESGKQNYLKAEHGAIEQDRRDRAKMEK